MCWVLALFTMVAYAGSVEGSLRFMTIPMEKVGMAPQATSTPIIAINAHSPFIFKDKCMIWKMDMDTAEEYMELARQMECYEISHQEFAEKLTFLRDYPLDRLAMPGEELEIKVYSKPRVGYRKGN